MAELKETPPLVAASGEELTDEEVDRVLAELCCKKCFGRGYMGWTLAGDPVMCDCVEKARKRHGKKERL